MREPGTGGRAQIRWESPGQVGEPRPCPFSASIPLGFCPQCRSRDGVGIQCAGSSAWLPRIQTPASDRTLVQPLWKAVRTFLKKLRTELPCGPAIVLLGIYPKGTDVVTEGAPAPRCSQQQCAQRPGCGKSPDVHRRLTDKEDAVHTRQSITQPSKIRKPAICIIVDGTRGYYSQ